MSMTEERKRELEAALADQRTKAATALAKAKELKLEIARLTKPTQAARIARCARRISATIDWAAVTELEGALGEAQNGPPQGMADGSVDLDLWRKARELRDASTVFGAAVDSVITELNAQGLRGGDGG